MVHEVLIIFGGVILVSAVGNILFRYIGLPEAVFMIILGVLVGPVFNVISPADINPVIPYLLTLTLVVLLFETGISTEISQALKAMKKSSIFTLTVLAATVFFSILILPFLGWEPHHSIIIGIIISGTSTAPVVYFTSRMTMKDEVRSFLVFESVINDVTLLTSLAVTLQILTVAINIQHLAISLIAYIMIPLLCGGVAAVFWVHILIILSPKMKVKYLSTIAFTIILYALTEYVNGSGVLAIVVFSLLVGNLHNISKASKFFPTKFEKFLSKLEQQLMDIRKVHDEISSMVENLFFFAMGVLFSLDALNSYITWLTVLLIFIVILSRLMSAGIISVVDRDYRKYILPISLMVPRGLTVGLATFLTIESTVQIPLLEEIVIVMIMLTTIITTISFLLTKRWLRKSVVAERNN